MSVGVSVDSHVRDMSAGCPVGTGLASDTREGLYLQEELDSLYDVDYNNRRSDDGGRDTAVFTMEWEQQTVQISTV